MCQEKQVTHTTQDTNQVTQTNTHNHEHTNTERPPGTAQTANTYLDVKAHCEGGVRLGNDGWAREWR